MTSAGAPREDAQVQPTRAGQGDLSPFLPVDRAVSDLLDIVVEVAADAIPALSGVSLSLLVGSASEFETTNASSALIRTIDESQYAADSGPCIEAIRTRTEVKATIPASAWPEFSVAAEQASIRSVWSLPLAVQDRVPGALNLYSSVDALWDTSSAEPARLLARHAAAVLHNGMALAHSEHVNLTLRKALETRTVIGQAQGVLMARQAITSDEAFDILRRASQRTNRKLRDVAAEIVEGVSHGGHHQ